jgi:hypothetical protein
LAAKVAKSGGNRTWKQAFHPVGRSWMRNVKYHHFPGLHATPETIDWSYTYCMLKDIHPSATVKNDFAGLGFY